MAKHICKLEPGRFYHVYNRGNNGENLFYGSENYKYFLRKYDEHLSDCLNTFAFCLLPNHFHLLVQVKDAQNVSHFENVKHLSVDKLVSKRFQAFFTGYAKAINKSIGRHGSLFEKPFRRIEVDNTRYLANLVFYIHANPQKHGICSDFRHYPWSSYDRILINRPTQLKKEDVLQWFNTPANYLAYQTGMPDIETIKHLILE